MDVKECTRCKEVKPLSDYCKSSRHRMGVQPQCKSCMNIAYNKSRKKKQEHYQQVSKDRRNGLVERLREWKSQLGCSVCPETDPCCLDLHHLDPAEKESAVSDLVGHGSSWETIMEEVSKCVILCRCCHAKVHAGRFSLL